MSKKLVLILLAIAAVIALLAVSIAAQEGEKKAEAEVKADPAEATHEYVGVEKCKFCHKDIYAAWEKTKHAHAWDALSDEEKKVSDCVKCHVTGKTADGELLTGVQCEACHGPGSDYKSFKIMNKKAWEADPEKQLKLAHEAGLIFPPTEKDCMRCHQKEGNPNFKPFDFAKMSPLVHPVPPAEGGE